MTSTSKPGNIVYFYFYSSEPEETIVIDAHPLSSGSMITFVGRGKNSRPTSKKNLFTTYSFFTNTVHITYDMIKSKGFKDLTGYYVVGVESYYSTNFSISWKHEFSKLLYP